MDLDETWQRDGGWGKSDPVKVLARSLQGPGERVETIIFVWSHRSIRFGTVCCSYSTDWRCGMDVRP